MGRRLVRKNLVLDAEELRELARRRKLSESAAAREAIKNMLAAEEVMDALTELRERGGIDDVFGRLPDESQT
jgi:predicted transcriptional regulator